MVHQNREDERNVSEFFEPEVWGLSGLKKKKRYEVNLQQTTTSQKKKGSVEKR
jgi:hypothetical protein